MSNNTLISILKANKLMHSKEEILAFDNALAELAENPQDVDLEELHLILDDKCSQPEVMWGIVHFLESFDAKEQLQAFLNVLPQLVISAPEWTEIIHCRIFNDELTRLLYQDMFKSVDVKTQQIVMKISADIARKNQFINV
jgi:Immunity protein 30